MMRKRISATDDRVILQLIKSELFPFAQQSFPDLKWDRKDIMKRLGMGRTFVACHLSIIPFGFVHCIIRDTTLWIDLLVVHGRRQKKGWGRKLLKRAERYGKLKRCDNIKLYVDQLNLGAQLFYHRQGYQQLSYEPAVKGFLFGKQLKKSE